MLSAKLFCSLAVLIASVEVIGCRGEAAPAKQLARAQSKSISAPPTSALANRDGNAISFAGRHARSLHGDAHREAFLSTYNNPESGISFRYPRNYALEEGDAQERSFLLKTQEDLDIERPGATLVATVFIPEDGYPNTTFEHGSLQLVTDASGTEKTCREEAPVTATKTVSGRLMVQGTAFYWTEEQTETGGVKALERTYSGYSQGTCYEFLLTLAVDETSDADGFRKPADATKIMKQLEKIVSSAEIFSKRVTPPTETTEGTANRL
jgi:hypothetical protein